MMRGERTTDDGSNNLHVLTEAISSMMNNPSSSDAQPSLRNTPQDARNLMQNRPPQIPVNDGNASFCNTVPDSSRHTRNIFTVEERITEEHRMLSESMVEMLAKTLTMTAQERQLLRDFIDAARHLDEAFIGRAETHGILTLLDPSIVDGRQAIAPVHSKILLPAIDRRNIVASSASLALSDCFLVARRVKEIGRSMNASSNAEKDTKFPSDERFPSWLSTDVLPTNRTDDTSVKHVRLNDAVMRGIHQLSLNELSSIYGEFFNHIWNICKKKLAWKGHVTYKKLTPPWLVGNVVFLYGLNHSSSITFQQGTLPRKSDLKERGQKIIGSAILAAWVVQEHETSLSLRWFLRQKGVVIDENNLDDNPRNNHSNL